MSGTNKSFTAYSNGMTLDGILDPRDHRMPDKYHPNKFEDLSACPEFLDGSIQRSAQEVVRDCMERDMKYLEISEEMRADTRAYPQEFIINCNMAYALSIPAPDWSDLYSYCKEITDSVDNGYPGFEVLMREISPYNLANTYAVFIGADYGVLPQLKADLNYTDYDVMRLAVLFDDDKILNKIIAASESPLTTGASVDQILASFVIDPFSAIRMSRAPENGVTVGELYARTKNQISATMHEAVTIEGFMSETPALQYRMAAQLRPEAIKCPQTGASYLKPSIGTLRAEDLKVPGIDHKLHSLPQFSDFVGKFKIEILQLLSECINSNINSIPDEGSSILADIVKTLNQHGISGKNIFLQIFSKLTPGQAAFMENENQFPDDEYLKFLLNFNETYIDKNKSSETNFLVKAEAPAAFKRLDLSDEELKAAYRIFGDRDFLSKMSDPAVESKLGVDLGL